MTLFLRRNWTLDYLIIVPDEWNRRHQSDFWLRMYEVLDRWQAERVLDAIAREDAVFLRKLTEDLAPCFPTAHPRAGSYEEVREDERRLDNLKRLLGSMFSKPGEPPRFAQFYICRRKRIAPEPRFLPDPFKKTREAIEAAKRAPRGYVVVEVVDDAGAPVRHQRLEVLLSDGEVVSRATDAQGQVRLDPIPQGQCSIRVPTLDGSAWHPAAGAASTPVDRGYKRVHLVRKGENLTLIARQHGVRGWKKLWNAPDNEPLRKKRKSPHVLHAGDEVVIPALEIHEIVRPTDQTHRIVVTEELVEFRVTLQDHNQQPFADQPYELRVESAPRAEPCKGTTTGSGKLVELLSALVERVEVSLPRAGVSWTFLLRDFFERPAEEGGVRRAEEAAVAETVMAMQIRLNALGFPCGAADGVIGPKTRDALALLEQQPEPGRAQPEQQQPGELALAALDRLEPLFAEAV